MSLIPTLLMSEPALTTASSTDPVTTAQYRITIDADYATTQSQLEKVDVSMDAFALMAVSAAMHRDGEPSLKDVAIQIGNIRSDAIVITYSLTAPQESLDLAVKYMEQSVGTKVYGQLGGQWGTWGRFVDFEMDDGSWSSTMSSTTKPVPDPTLSQRTVIIQSQDGVFGLTLTTLILLIILIVSCLLCMAVAVWANKGCHRGYHDANGEYQNKYAFVVGFQNLYRIQKARLSKDAQQLEHNIAIQIVPSHDQDEGPPLPNSSSSTQLHRDSNSGSSMSPDDARSFRSNPSSAPSRLSSDSISIEEPVPEEIAGSVTTHGLQVNYQYDMEGTTDDDTASPRPDKKSAPRRSSSGTSTPHGHGASLGVTRGMTRGQTRGQHHKLENAPETTPETTPETENGATDDGVETDGHTTETDGCTPRGDKDTTVIVYDGHYPLRTGVDSDSDGSSTETSGSPGTWLWFGKDSVGMSVQVR